MNDEIYLKRLGKKILHLRNQKGISQETMAELINSHHTQIGRIERGEVNPTINTLRGFAKFFEIEIEELVKV